MQAREGSTPSTPTTTLSPLNPITAAILPTHDSLRSKTDTAQVNETLAKVLCHNLVVLIHEMYELGIDPVFWAESSPTQEVAG